MPKVALTAARQLWTKLYSRQICDGEPSGRVTLKLAVRQTLKKILARPAQLLHAHCRRVIGRADPALQILKVVKDARCRLLRGVRNSLPGCGIPQIRVGRLGSGGGGKDAILLIGG